MRAWQTEPKRGEAAYMVPLWMFKIIHAYCLRCVVVTWKYRRPVLRTPLDHECKCAEDRFLVYKARYLPQNLTKI